MNRILKWALAVVLAACTALFVLYMIRSSRSSDAVAPQISFDSELIQVSVQDDPGVFLTGVTAQDDRDGNVTSSLVVEKVSPIREDHCITVTYAAFDQAGNVAKATRQAHYTDYQGPKFTLSAPMLFRSGLSMDLFRYVGARDPLDGDISNQVKIDLAEGSSGITDVGIYQFQLRVTNKMGQTVRLTIPVEIYPNGLYNASVSLTDYLVYIPKNQVFAPAGYLKTLRAGNRELPIHSIPAEEISVQIHSEVQTHIPGVYRVTYTVQYGEFTGYTALIVVVEE